MRLIDADALKEKAYTSYECKSQPCKVVDVNDIDDAPTVSAEKVVHCIDCIYWGMDIGMPIGRQKKCHIDHLWHPKEWFCAWGERMEDT